MRRLETLVRQAAVAVPDRIAVHDRQSAWTYAELDRRSDCAAGCFRRLGVGAGDRIGVWAPKSAQVIAAFQGALRLGAAYVPVEPAAPPLRATTIFADCGVKLIVTTAVLAAALDGDRPVVLVDDLDCPDAEPVPPLAAAAEDDLAYLLYTSGSTGVPKGVCISHRNAWAFVEWAVDAVGASSRDVYANHAAFNFDLSVLDLYGAFLTRGTVCLVPEDSAYLAGRLVEFLSHHAVSVWYSVPSVLALMIEHGALLSAAVPPPAVIIFAGEPFPIRYVRMLRANWPRTRLFNFYGPTETNVCTSYEVLQIERDRTTPVPIGSAASGNRVWAVKDNGAVAREGERGELCVDGPTVMLGYWGSAPQRGPYRTGDLCLVRGDGEYEFIGRRDHLVKHRGHRVELLEIEAVLTRHAGVREAAVLAVGSGIDQRLVAFVVPAGAPAPTLLDLKAFSARYLPRYMLIDHVHTMGTLPKTANGKLDRLALQTAAAVA